MHCSFNLLFNNYLIVIIISISCEKSYFIQVLTVFGSGTSREESILNFFHVCEIYSNVVKKSLVENRLVAYQRLYMRRRCLSCFCHIKSDFVYQKPVGKFVSLHMKACHCLNINVIFPFKSI